MKKSNWSSVKGKVVGVRFGEIEFKGLVSRAENRGVSVGSYLKWLLRRTEERQGVLRIWEELRSEG